MIEIHKINNYSDNDSVIGVGVYDKDELLADASYVIEQDCLKIINIRCDNPDVFIADSLVKTLLFYADIAKIQFVQFDLCCKKFFSNYKYLVENDKCVLNIFEQNLKCHCQ